MEVLKEDMRHLLLSCVRYSMGRRTYMPSYCAAMVQQYNKSLEDHQLEQISKEIEEELHIHKGKQGDQCDTDAWKQLSLWCIAEVERRKEDDKQL